MLDVAHAYQDEGRPERVRALVTALGDGTMLAIGSDVGQIDDLEDEVAQPGARPASEKADRYDRWQDGQNHSAITRS